MKTHTIHVTDGELAIILGGLRLLEREGIDPAIAMVVTDCHKYRLPDAAEIEGLALRLNEQI